MKYILLPLLISVNTWAVTSVQVVTSFSILEDISRNILPSKFEIHNIVGAGQDSHGYQTTPQDYLSFRKADLILLVGENFEPWAQSTIKKIKTKAKIYYVTKNTDLIKLPSPHHHDHDHTSMLFDPHFWQSPQLVMQMIQNLSMYLQAEYPDSKIDIETKTSEYLKKIKALQLQYKTEFEKLDSSSKKMVISHNSFQYFAKEFNVIVDSPLDASQEGDTSVKRISKLVQKIKDEKINSLFLEKSSPAALMKSIAKSTNREISGTLYSDCLSADDTASTYLKMIDYNFNLILKSMKGSKP